MTESEKKKDDEKQLNNFLDIFSKSIAYVGSEPFVLAQLEEYFSPKPASLSDFGDAKEIQSRLDKLTYSMGGPPKVIITTPEKDLKTYDTHSSAIMYELVNSFHRLRKVVCRAHLSMLGLDNIKKHPEWFINLPPEGVIRDQYMSTIEDSFWEHCESGYINLCSFWDRVGQVFDFAFFNIRQFERDGYSAVLDRIRTNVLPIKPKLAELSCWTKLRDYQSSEKTSGLKWLLRRRNLIIHSLHLREIQLEKDKDLYKSSYNHLEEKYRKKLCPQTPVKEINIVHDHLRNAAESFQDVLSLVEFTIDNR